MPRVRRGKGFIMALDAAMPDFIETQRKELGYFPSLREIAEACSPPETVAAVYCSIKRLLAAGKLSKEATIVYTPKTIQRGEKRETIKSIKTKKGNCKK